MATFERTWTSQLNQIISDGATPDAIAQYQSGFFKLHTFLQSAGWLLKESCGLNGGGPITAGVGDNILSATDVVIGLNGSQPHSWAFYEMPTGWIQGGKAWILISTNDSNVSATPYQLIFKTAIGTIFSGGTTTTAPTSPNEYQSLENTFTPQGNAAKVNSRVHASYADNGDFYWGWSEDGTDLIETVIWMGAFDATKTVEQGGPDDPNWAFFVGFSHDPTVGGSGRFWGLGGFDRGTFQVPTFIGDWSITQNATGAYSIADSGTSPDMDSWTNGVSDASGRTIACEIEFTQDAAAGRYMGKVIDIRALPVQLPLGTVDDADPTPTTRYANVGQIALPVQNSQLPMVF